MMVVIPIGAMVSGAFAASGYYSTALMLHVRPAWWILGQLLVVAAVAQFAIYYADYLRYAPVGSGKGGGGMSFIEFVDLRLTTTHLLIGRAETDTGPLGQWGYLLGLAEFVGFILGGVWVFTVLRGHPSCGRCGNYFRRLARKEQTFAGEERLANYYDHLFSHPPLSPEFARELNAGTSRAERKAGDFRVLSQLHGCPSCGAQHITQEVQAKRKRNWTAVPALNRSVAMPDGLDARRPFNVAPGI
jgi:hypothetical protein